MYYVLIAIHVIVCLFLILVVLLQTGKGAEMGATFGGGSSQTLFGSRGAATFMNKLTTAVAVTFMLTSLVLAVMSARRDAATLIPEEPRTEQPAAQVPAPGTSGPVAEPSAAPAAPADDSKTSTAPAGDQAPAGATPVPKAEGVPGKQ